MGNKLYPHQEEGVRRALKEPFFALFMEQRTGKTPVAITTLRERYLKGELHRVFIFAPNNLLYNWSLEIKEWMRLRKDQFKVLRLKGKGKKSWSTQLEEFMEYDYELRKLKDLKDLGLGNKKKDIIENNQAPLMLVLMNYEKARVLEPILRKMKVQGLIIDESQRVKSRNAQVSKSIYRLTRKCIMRLLMTGTPVGKGYEDLFMQYKIMDGDIFGDGYGSFESRYIQKGGYMGKEIVGYKHIKELKSTVADTSYRVSLEDCIDLPPVNHRYVTCELTGKALGAYQGIYDELYTQVPIEATRGRLKATLRKYHMPYQGYESYLSLLLKAQPYLNVSSCDLTITQLIRLHQLTGGFLKLDTGELVQLGDDKLKATVDYLQDQKLPVVIFCNFVDEIRLLESRLKKAYPKRVVVNYRDHKHKPQVEDQFKAGKVDIIILQIHSGSTGLNLQKADQILLYSTNRSADDYLQAMARIKGPSQEHPMTIVHLMCEDTIDFDILENLESKTKLIDKLWD